MQINSGRSPQPFFWPTGEEITGEAAFDPIEAGKTRRAVGEFTASEGLFQTVPLEVLLWVITYIDSGGQTRQQGIGSP